MREKKKKQESKAPVSVTKKSSQVLNVIESTVSTIKHLDYNAMNYNV